MGWMLRNQISFCVAGERACFLDLEADRYFALTDQADAAFRRLSAGQSLDRRESEVLAPLIASGLLQPCDGTQRPLPCLMPHPPSADRDAMQGPRAGLGLIVRAGMHIWAAERALKKRGLKALLTQIEAERQNPKVSSEDAFDLITPVVHAFRFWDLMVSPRDRCLPRSIAMMRMLGSCPSQLVFAVMTRPFQAHCWVQYRNHVLNDRLAHVRAFTPIRII